MNDLPNEASLEDLRRDALKHYDELSTKAHHWSSVIPQAINYYFDRKIEEQNDIKGFPTDVEIRKWWKTTRFQREDGEQEYRMIYEIDLPKILKAFVFHFNPKTTFAKVSEQEPPYNTDILAKSPSGTYHICSWRPAYNIFTCQNKRDTTEGWGWKLLE